MLLLCQGPSHNHFCRIETLLCQDHHVINPPFQNRRNFTELATNFYISIEATVKLHSYHDSKIDSFVKYRLKYIIHIINIALSHKPYYPPTIVPTYKIDRRSQIHKTKNRTINFPTQTIRARHIQDGYRSTPLTPRCRLPPFNYPYPKNKTQYKENAIYNFKRIRRKGERIK
jgi:hypothetical protein